MVTTQTVSYCEDLPVTIQSIHAVFHTPLDACLCRGEDERSNERAGWGESVQNLRSMNQVLGRVLQVWAVRILHAANDTAFAALISRRIV